MAAAMSKRQQARNERALQELIKSVPGNNSCADCGANNPGTSRVLATIGRYIANHTVQDGQVGTYVYSYGIGTPLDLLLYDLY